MANKKRSKTPVNGEAPLFIRLDPETSIDTIRTFVDQVLAERHPKIPDPARMAAEVSSEIARLGLKTLSVQLVSGFIANRLAEQKPERTDDGLLIPQLSDNAITVLNKRYLKKDDSGKPIEQPHEMFIRVAKTIAEVDATYGTKKDVKASTKIFYERMALGQFIPNSPTLMNAGRQLGQLSACFVLPVEDSMESIFEAVKHTAMIHKSGGGTGFSFSRLRPKADLVKSTKGVSSGPLSFITVFDAATETIKQGGTRRGANMAILRIDHPDILDFIACKSDTKLLNNFNISVGVTEPFMKALDKGTDYALLNPRTGKSQGKLSAKMVFELIVEKAWQNGEPGMIFLDRLNQANPTPGVGELEATNPCGEQPLLPYESCNLGSINLAKMIGDNAVDFDLLKQVVHDAVHFLDNVIDANRYPLEMIREQTLGNRKIGLGVMGWADLLLQLEIPYDSTKALKLAEKVMGFVRKEAFAASCTLAEARGEFPNIDKSVFASHPNGKRPRNATVTTVAPTGTISIIAGASSGIEPLFAISFHRKVLDGEKLVETNPYFELVAKQGGFFSTDLMANIAEVGSVQDLPDVPDAIKRIYVTSHEIAPEWHVKMQSAFQKHTDNAVSKTVNFPAEAKPADVAKVFKLAYSTGCKGITVYRYGSRDSVLSVQGSKTAATPVAVPEEAPVVYNVIAPRARSDGPLTGTTELKAIGCGKLYVTINSDQYGINELFTSVGRKGGCPSQSEATGRLISLALRSGIKLEAITKQLKGIRCHSAIRRNELTGKKKPSDNGRAVSCPAAIAAALEARFSDAPSAGAQGPLVPEPFEFFDKIKQAPEVAGTKLEREYLAKNICPDCGAAIEHEGGCVVCHSCGYSKCG
jgi:ribonucleoside-diphosphate reductase alpha chain